MGLIESVYFRSPLVVQSAAVALYGTAWYFRRHGRHFRAKVRSLEANERLSAADFAQLQLRELNRILELALRSPYYRPKIEEAALDRPLNNLAELRRMPLLSKQVLRTQPRDLFTGKPPWGTKCLRSSGTSGTPTDIYFTRKFHQESLAYFQARCRAWAGVDRHARRAMFGVRKVCAFDQPGPPFWRSSPMERLVYYSIYHLSPVNMQHYVDHLTQWQPGVIMGYPSALNVLAHFLIDTGQSLAIPAAITTSETVTPDVRSAIERGFGCRLFDQYGAVESTHFVAQCEHGRYHVSPERGIIEILDNDRPCEPGQEGRVVVTGLENTLQPLIRYEIGDVAYWATEQSCPCGRQMPILGGIQGRYEDYCVTPDGRRILRFDTVFKGIVNIVEAQVIQEAIDRFSICVVPTAEFNATDRDRLRSNFRQHAGDAKVEIITVDAIPRTKSGKFRAVINRMTCAGTPAEAPAAR